MHLHGPPTVLTVNLGAKYFSTRLRPLASFPLSPRDCGCCGVLNTTLPSIAITAESAPWAVLFDRSTLESPCIPEMRSASSPPVPTKWFLPHAGLHMATAHFRSQELRHGTRYRPGVTSVSFLSSFRRLLKTFLFQRQLRQ